MDESYKSCCTRDPESFRRGRSKVGKFSKQAGRRRLQGQRMVRQFVYDLGDRTLGPLVVKFCLDACGIPSRALFFQTLSFFKQSNARVIAAFFFLQ